MSRASHRRRPITPATTVGLALLAALITVWLGVVAQFGGVVGATTSSTPVPDALALIQVQAGETLQQVAHRVAPDAPVAHVVDRIRELNQLESTSLEAGQTLIAPVG
jgi:predicted Zn-dependent protease